MTAASLVPAEVDLQGTPVPREAFAQAAVDLFGIDIEMARRWANQAADRFERPRVGSPAVPGKERR